MGNKQSVDFSSQQTIRASEPQTLVAWSSYDDSSIRLTDLRTPQEPTRFTGATSRLANYDSDIYWTHVKEIPNTKLLIAIASFQDASAGMAIFDLNHRGKVKQFFSFEGAFGVAGIGDVAFNSRRNLLCALPAKDEYAYHLFSVAYTASKSIYDVKLLQKAKWSSQHQPVWNNDLAGFDLDRNGERVATIDQLGTCVISNVNSQNSLLTLDLKSPQDGFSCCRWSTNVGESLLFLKYGGNLLNIMDIEKGVLTLKVPIQLDDKDWTHGIDICQNNGNLLLAGGLDRTIKVYDKRSSEIIKKFDRVHWGIRSLEFQEPFGWL